MIGQPSANGENGNGRDPETGRFKPGWKGGPGNPRARQAAAFREAMMRAVTPADIKKVVRKLLQQALNGNVQAAKELLNRCVGEPLPYDVMERISELERIVAEGEGVQT